MEAYLIEEEPAAAKEFCAVQYANMGKSYLDATRILLSNINEITVYRFAPPYFSVSHSIELLLKSFLIKCGAIDKFKHEHNLIKLVTAAEEKGLLIEPSDKYTIEALNDYIMQEPAKHQFRYPVIDTKCLPTVDELIDVADNIQRLIIT